MEELLIVLIVLVGIAVADFLIIGHYIKNVMRLIERLIPYIREDK
jgi:hypothetical protein